MEVIHKTIKIHCTDAIQACSGVILAPVAVVVTTQQGVSPSMTLQLGCCGIHIVIHKTGST